MANDLTRPIVGIENRTAQEVFDIMVDRFRRTPPPQAHLAGQREIIANIIDPHSFLPDTSGDDLIAEMVKQGQDLAFSKADRILAALAATAKEGSAE